MKVTLYFGNLKAFNIKFIDTNRKNFFIGFEEKGCWEMKLKDKGNSFVEGKIMNLFIYLY